MINNSHNIEYKKLFYKLKSHPINQWIIDKGWEWFPHQIQILKSIEKNNSVLVQSPTGTGKTLTGFLPSLLSFNYDRQKSTLNTLYISAQSVFDSCCISLNKNGISNMLSLITCKLSLIK